MKSDKKVIIITGGSSGLGRATAKILAVRNQVVILARNEKEVKKTAGELKCDGMVCDVTDEKQIEKTFSKIISKYGKVDCLINCAGVWSTGPIDKSAPEEIRNVILINTVGTMLTVNALVPQLKKQQYGRIINVSSQAGLNAKPDRSVYNASKWAITGFTKSIQPELAAFNISVCGFYPGFFRTDIFEKAGDMRTNFDNAMPVEKVAKELAYLVDIDPSLVIKSFEIQSINELRPPKKN